MGVEHAEPSGYPLILIWLDPSESASAEPGAMVSCQGMTMSRACGGYFGGWVSFAPDVSGSVAELGVGRYQKVQLQAGSLLAFSGDAAMDSEFQGLGTCSVVGWPSSCDCGLVRTAVSSGAAAYGVVSQVAVSSYDDELVVDTCHLVAFESGVPYSVRNLSRFRALLFDGEGLVLKFRDTGNVGSRLVISACWSAWCGSLPRLPVEQSIVISHGGGLLC